jgi:hypothetical protein
MRVRDCPDILAVVSHFRIFRESYTVDGYIIDKVPASLTLKKRKSGLYFQRQTQRQGNTGNWFLLFTTD